MKVKTTLLFCLFIAASACSSIKKTAVKPIDTSINNIAWTVTSFKGHALATANFANGLPSIMFNMTDGKLSGSDGCNNFMGLAQYGSGYLKPGPIASTKMACANPTIQTEFYEVLAAGKLTYRLENGTLRLYLNDAEVMALTERM